jgi:hypothetical protein
VLGFIPFRAFYIAQRRSLSLSFSQRAARAEANTQARQGSKQEQEEEGKFYIDIFFSPFAAWYNIIVCYDRIINELLVITLTSIRTNKYVFFIFKREK